MVHYNNPHHHNRKAFQQDTHTRQTPLSLTEADTQNMKQPTSSNYPTISYTPLPVKQSDELTNPHGPTRLPEIAENCICAALISSTSTHTIQEY